MEIVLLGAGGYHPNSHRHTTCVMIPERGILIDAGSGAFRVASRLATEQLDLFLTHAHLDHISGLTFLLGLFPGDDPARMRVFGEREKLDAVRQHLYSDPIFPVEPNWTPSALPAVTGKMPLRGGGSVTWFPLDHPGGSIGYRFDGLDSAAPGKSFALVTDTTAAEDAEYRRHLDGVDLLIHEAYFEDSRRDFAVKTGHSCVGEVARLAADIGAARLVLTHMNPRVDEHEPFDLGQAKEVFSAVEFGQDEMVIDL